MQHSQEKCFVTPVVSWMVIVCQFTTIQTDMCITFPITEAHQGTGRKWRRRSTRVYHFCTIVDFVVGDVEGPTAELFLGIYCDNYGVSVPHKSQGHIQETHVHTTRTSSGHGHKGEEEEHKGISLMSNTKWQDFCCFIYWSLAVIKAKFPHMLLNLV